MKITAFLLLVTLFQIQANPFYGQNIKITIDLKNVALDKILFQIEKQTSYKIMYNDKDIDYVKKMSIKATNEKLSSVLERLFANTNVVYQLLDKQIILKKDLNKKLKNNSIKNEKQAFQINIKGTITDVSGEPLPDASIVEKGTTNGTSSDFDGKFALTLKNNNATIVVSYVGYQTQEIKITNQTNLSIVLIEDATSLDEVVVTALGLKREKKALGYSVQEISGDQVQAVKTVDVATSLTGKVSGLWIQNSTEFNSSPSIVLRGVNPLIVIDGVPYGNMKLGEVSQDDIKSINVLKGATASALYGARGGNGAIMITTKKGGNEITVNSNNMFFAGYLALPETHHSYSAGINGVYSATDYIWGQKLDIGILADQWNPETKQIENMPLTSRGKNNFKNFLEPGLITNNNITFSSTSDQGSIRTSLTHVYNKGQYPNLTLNKVNANVTGELNLGDKVKITSTVGYNRSYTPQTVGAGYGSQGYIYQILMWTGPEYDLTKFKDYWITPHEKQNWHYKAWYDNPYLIAYEKTLSSEKNLTNINLTTDYSVFQDAKITARVGYDYYSNESIRRNPPGIFSTRGWAANGLYAQNQTKGYSINTDLLFNYNKKDALIKGFDVDFTSGFSMYKWEDQSLYAATRGGIVVPGIYSLKNSFERPDVSASTYRKQVNSLLGIASLSYKNTVFVDVTGRNDWSSTLAKTERSYFYPSVAGSILVDKFLTIDWLDLWKVRGSWTLSKSDLGVYATNVNYNVTTGTWGDKYNEASYTSTIKNAVVKPEITRTWEIGTAAYFLKNRLNVDIAYYNKFNYNRQQSATISSASGFTSTLINTKETIVRKGVEIGINADVIEKNDFKWTVAANWSTSHSYLKDLDPVYSPDNLWTYSGARRDVYTQRDWLRDPQGNIIHTDGGLPIRSDYSTVIGYKDPDFIWGLTNSLSWKNFRAHISFDGRVGGTMYNYTNNKMWDTGSHPDSDNQWRYDEVVNGNKSYIGQGVKVISGSATYDEYGRIIEDTRVYAPNDIETSYQNYARRYRDGKDGAADPTFFKLRELSIGYSVPKNILKKVNLNSADISLTAQNVFLWTKEFRFVDPDSNNDDLSSPSQRFIGLNIKLSTSSNSKKNKL